MSDRISVAMATYNGEKYLREQLESIYSQTRIPDEVVVSDDHSQDGTVAILEEYKQTKGLKYVVNAEGLGVNKNFENAVRLCTGDYICISDQDDVWFPQKIEISIEKLKEIEGAERIPSLVSSAAQFTDKDLNKLPTTIPGHDIDMFEESISGYFSQGSSLFLNRELIDMILPFPTEKLLYDDYIGTSAACIGRKYYIAQLLMYYRLHGANAFYGHHGKMAQNRRLFDRILSKISYLKYDSLFPSQRFDAVEYVFNRFESVITPERTAYIKNMLLYRHGNLPEKLSSVKYLVHDKQERRRVFFITAVMYFIPISNINRISCEDII